LIVTLLSGIVKVECQYAVGRYFIDFFLTECGLAIEYDEYHHSRPRNVIADREREKAIRQAIPNVQFIRVQEGQELVKLNEVLRRMVKKTELKP
jgi:very-short-patch-repair endonuclease